ncbi:RING finger protein 24 [Lonchura striata]|uniref:RING finger protein 24 n=1 Tax=Lonchura striata TaxID=40157 RepID=A0A218V9M6_9PASE|nr:RING finger protein 24 [Lonchura striata domestica]
MMRYHYQVTGLVLAHDSPDPERVVELLETDAVLKGWQEETSLALLPHPWYQTAVAVQADTFGLRGLAALRHPCSLPMSSDFQHYSFRMPNIGFQNLPLNIYIVVFGTAIFVFILSLLFCCYLIRLRHQAHKELYAYKQVILKEKVKELNLHEICAVCLEEFKPKDELGICPCKHAFHRK